MEENINPLQGEISALESQIAAIDVHSLDPNDNGKIINSPAVETTQPSAPVAEDPIKSELERIKGQTAGKTPQEKFAYKLKLEAQRAKEMGVDVNAILGVKTQPVEDDYSEEERPLTRKEVEEMLAARQPKGKSATELAMEIDSESERELHLYYLENVIRSTGNGEQDFNMAKTMVDAVKLKSSVALNSARPEVRSHSTASSFVPNTTTANTARLTQDEEMLYNDALTRGLPFTKEEIIAARLR